MIEMPKYQNPVSLIPGGCPQLLDYEAPASILDEVKYAFEEISDKKGEAVRLHAFRKNGEGDFEDEMFPGKISAGYGYEFDGAKALRPWLGHWLPLPFLRSRQDGSGHRFDYGPANWARGRLVHAAGGSLRLTLAFDMKVEKKKDVYAALTENDVDANAHFALAWRFPDNAWFMDLAWVEEWLRQLWDDWRKQSGRRDDDGEWKFEHLASYLCYLEVVQKTSRACEVYVIRPDGKNCVDVDLVLDIGNSRTTGILVESRAQTVTNLNDSYLLQLRDMSQPENIYTDPFETRVEFSEINFGNNALSLRSGRLTPAFVWPSPVRIGPEASRLSTLSRCGKGSTGMSSPKRYLWDERDWKRTWRFNTGSEQAPYVTRGPLAQRINSSGTPLCCMDDPLFTRNRILRAQERESAFESLFTRSSLMMFLLIEIIQQALLTINSPGQRLRRDTPAEPRRLRRIIFTVPPGMPMAEQRIYRRWARWAVRALWEALGWEKFYVDERQRRRRGGYEDYRESPMIRCDWDEATCTQLVFIFNEITRKFQGDARMFCELFGRERDFDGRKAPSVRLAAIDIGGGTTDLSITTFELANDEGSTPRVAAHPEFHDGFNLAGDDILRAVACAHVLEPLGEALVKAGAPDARQALARLFGRDTMDSSKAILDRRAQFVRQVVVPAALRLLSLYEEASQHKQEKISFRLGECFESREESAGEPVAGLFPRPGQAATSYVNDFARAQGAPDFDVLETRLELNSSAIDETVRSSLKEVLANLCEIINMYDCDMLLLTGRPTRWPGLVDAIVSLAPLPPGRIQPMGDYRVGGWYPFSDPLGNMTDPKTTVVVGAILCALAEGQLEGFSFDPGRLGLVSTARYIGEMELTGQIKKSKVWFNVDPLKKTVEPKEVDISFTGPISVGFRQLDAERWTTTRFYSLDYASEAAREENPIPLKVKLGFSLRNDDGDADSERDEGEFTILETRGRDGGSAKGRPLDIRLQTLPRDEGFWMDTGIMYEA